MAAVLLPPIFFFIFRRRLLSAELRDLYAIFASGDDSDYWAGF